MTPDQHRARAEKLIADAEVLYTALQGEVSTEASPDQTGWRLLDTTLHLAQAHAALATPAPGPSAPPFGADGHHGSGIIHYGDADPTYDRM